MKMASPQNRMGLPDSPASNNNFLRSVFDGLEEPLRPFILAFHGAPAAYKNWAGVPWHKNQATKQNDRLNWYFTLAAFEPADGIYKRQERQCGMIFGIMLDDLGTKAAPLGRLGASPPTYVIETSAANYQAGYLFDTPQTDLAAVAALNEALVQAGLCDPGAKSPATRWGRLPFASNSKHTPPFPCRLMAFEPTRRYSIAQIMEGLELAPPVPKRRAALRQTRAEPTTEHDDSDVFTAAQDENPVLAALKLRGLYKGLLGVGKHDVTCPWVNL
ncbi:MAG: DNA-primase RepB domain-containing protein, partial [Candidatus Igneacidithiobacillus chanchocoensis]